MADLITQDEAEERCSMPDGLLTAEQLDHLREHLAEKEAEGAWLRYAENLGWEEDYLESLIESGLRSRT